MVVIGRWSDAHRFRYGASLVIDYSGYRGCRRASISVYPSTSTRDGSYWAAVETPWGYRTSDSRLNPFLTSEWDETRPPQLLMPHLHGTRNTCQQPTSCLLLPKLTSKRFECQGWWEIYPAICTGILFFLFMMRLRASTWIMSGSNFSSSISS